MTEWSASSEIRRLLLAGKTVDGAAICEKYDVGRSTIHSTVSKLRKEGLVIHLDDGRYSLDAVPADEVEERRAAKSPDEHPPLGSSLRVVRVELAGRRAVTTLDDGVDEWVGQLVRRVQRTAESE